MYRYRLSALFYYIFLSIYIIFIYVICICRIVYLHRNCMRIPLAIEKKLLQISYVQHENLFGSLRRLEIPIPDPKNNSMYQGNHDRSHIQPIVPTGWSLQTGPWPRVHVIGIRNRSKHLQQVVCVRCQHYGPHSWLF